MELIGGFLCALVLDYVSQIVYSGEPIIFSLRASDGKELAGWLEQYSGSDTLLRKDPFFIGGAGHIRLRMTEPLRLVKLRVGDEEAMIRALRLNEAMPALTARGDRLYDETGHFVTVELRKVTRTPDRRWAWIRWLGRKLNLSRQRFKSVSLILPQPYADSLHSDATVLRYPVGGTALPILEALCAVAANPPEEQAALLLTGFDEEHGTDPQLFGRAVEAILQILRKRGVRHIELLEAIPRPGYEGPIETYRAVLRRIAFNYRTELTSLGLSNDDWALSGGVYLKRLTPKGTARLHSALNKAVEALRAPESAKRK